MNRIIKVIELGTPKETRKSIKFIVDQIEKHNFAICSDGDAIRVFGKCLPENYKDSLTIIFSKGYKRKAKIPPSLITLKPEYTIERYDDFSFRIKLK